MPCKQFIKGYLSDCTHYSVPLDEVILKDAIVELKGVNWFSLGIQLDIEKCELDKMKSKHPHDENLCMIEVLDYWLKNTSDPTWHNLADAVEKVGGHSKVVENLRARQELNGMSLQLLQVFIIQSYSWGF